ncbi:Cna B-type domain-containing protein [Clostridiaceae bacterium 68-1-5]|uniref:Cna B-type domain-containing protein n=1 Tax=Suipraeoptans intestinalis TaxID=2606628 RepID=A0A6N7USB0_9FIRM|nr:Cna B-type domain-containing protein [Suipraeoptans intestinalis]MSR93783.1 Cna B-type domain-containing protein [Suipraeoptans intestinalis]
MKGNRKKIAAGILAVAMLMTSILPGINLVYAEDHPAAAAGVSVEESQTGKATETESLAGGFGGLMEDSREVPEAAVERSAAEATGLREEDTEKIDLKIARLTENGLQELPEVWYTQQQVDSVVDLDVSGNTYSVDAPYLLIRVPKTDKITDLRFVDSQAGTTERYEDGEYNYVKYTYPRITGGTHYSYQYFFKFDGNHARNDDSIEVKAGLYQSDGTPIQETTHKYVVRTIGFALWSVHGNSGLINSEKKATENGHRYVVTGYVEQMGDAKTAPNTIPKTNVFSAIYPDKIEGVNESVGMEIPKNIKVVYTFPEDEPGMRADSVGVHGAGKHTKNIHDNKVEILLENVNFNKIGSPADWTNGRQAVGANIRLAPGAVSVNKDIPITIDYYKNVDENGNGGEYVGRRIETFYFKPVPYSQNGRFSYGKHSHADHYIGEEFVYIYSPEYHYLDGKIYKGAYRMNERGIPLRIRAVNVNNGSSYENRYSGGETTEIKAVYSRLDSAGVYFKSTTITTYATDEQNPYNAEHRQAVIDAINNGNTKLYGIDKAGTEHLIQEHVKYDTPVLIEDKHGNYEEIVVKFEKPIVLDNAGIQLRERVWLSEEEMKKLDALSDGSLTYNSSTSVSYYDTAKKEYVKGAYLGQKGTASIPTYFLVSPLHPVVNEFADEPRVVEYANDATFRYLVGPALPRINHDSATYGDLEKIPNVRTITLLPPGFEYTGKFEKRMYDSQWRTNPIEPKVTEVKNFQGTGKTAVIVEYGGVTPASYYPLYLELRATKYAARGENKFTNYLTYDENDYIRPYGTGNNRENDYVDALDLDQDGDTSEIFMKKDTTVTFVPPLELLLNNTVRYDGEYATGATGDLGYAIQYKINLFNNSIKDVEKLSILDVLPAVGDHSISPNEQNAYVERKSTYATPLTGSLEEANPDILEKVEFFYQLSDQGTDLGSVRDGVWVTRDQVTDFTKVKSVKISLKEGQVLKPKEELNIVIPARIPGDKELDEKTSLAVNSSAFSTNGKNYTEGNKVSVDFLTYLVKGIAYLDLNKNGQYDDKDILASNVGVRIVNPDGTAATDFNGKEIKGKTDDKGAYSLPVYKRGNYLVAFDKQASQAFQGKTSGGEEVANSILETSITENTAQTREYTLSPTHRQQIMNVALLPEYGSVHIIKTSADEKNEDGSPKRIADTVFSIRTQDGKEVVNYKGEKIANVTTDEKGEAQFELVPHGTYVVREVSTQAPYVVSTKEYPVTLSGTEKEAELTISNQRKKGTISVHKTDNTTRKKALAGVEFTLSKDGKVVEKKLTDQSGDVVFSDVAYGDYVLKESKGLAGYTASEKEIPIAVREQGKTYSYHIVNDLMNPEISLSGEKVWNDGEDQDGKRPDEVVVILVQNGRETQMTTKATKEGNWKYSFTHLPTFDEKGDKIVYSVTEKEVPGYEASIEGTTITNTYTPEHIDIPVEKVWVDNEDAKGLRPESVRIELYADEEKAAEYELTAKDSWKHTFKDLPKYKKGKEIQYTVKELEETGYSASYSGEAETLLTITNTIKGKVSVPVTKKWIGKPADSAVIYLLADGKKIEKAVLTKEKNWQHTFAGLEQYRDGKEIKYTIEEEKIAGYTSEIAGDTTNFLVTNTYKDVKKPGTSPKTGETSPVVLYSLLTVASMILAGRAFKRKRVK